MRGRREQALPHRADMHVVAQQRKREPDRADDLPVAGQPAARVDGYRMWKPLSGASSIGFMALPF